MVIDKEEKTLPMRQCHLVKAKNVKLRSKSSDLLLKIILEINFALS